MRKCLLGLFGCLFGVVAQAGPIANIDYVHGQIDNVWGFEIPFKQDNIVAASNMKYLLAAVDRANYIINGYASSNYLANEKYATVQATDTIAANEAIDTLIVPKGLVFRTVRDAQEFSIQIALAGDFTIDWGDGTVQDVSSDTAEAKIYTHSYAKPQTYYIKPRGNPTAYNQDADTATVKIVSTDSLYRIYGTLGSVFPTLADGSQPSFNGFCIDCINLRGSIPEDFFENITGQPRANMFKQLFYFSYTPQTNASESDKWSKMKGTFPNKLFSGLSGTPTEGLFDMTFRGCHGLTGSLSAELFAGIRGDIKDRTFKETFSCCSGLTGSLPSGLFAGVTGRPAVSMFRGTFEYCPGFTGAIPTNLFAGISGAPAPDMFANTFKYASNIGAGQMPHGLFAGIKGAPNVSMYWATFNQARKVGGELKEGFFGDISGTPQNYMFADVFAQSGVTKIDANLFSGISGAPATGMFMRAFMDTRISEVPEGLFAGVRGAPRAGMFYRTFHWTRRLTKIPSKLFDGLSGPLEYEVEGTDSTGAPVTLVRSAAGAFKETFDYSTIKEIPEDLFGDSVFTGGVYPTYSGEDQWASWQGGVFQGMFSNATNLTGASLKMYYELEDGTISTERKPIYEIWTPTTDQNTYVGATGLDDYAEIPDIWK